MIEYNEFEVTVLEDIKDILSKSSYLDGHLRREDIYLLDVPEEAKTGDVVVRIDYVTSGQSVFFGNESHGDMYIVQIDAWRKLKDDRDVGLTFGLANRIKETLTEIDFNYAGHEKTDLEKDVGMYKVARRYTGVLRKSY